MRIIFKDIDGIDPHRLFKLIKDILIENKIKSNISLSIDKVITFHAVGSTDKLFLSSVINRVYMNADDPRQKTLKRDYLESKRLTASQFEAVEYIMKSMLNNLKIKAGVYMDEFDDGNHTELRLSKPTSFPVN
jgi:hypothetical protein